MKHFNILFTSFTPGSHLMASSLRVWRHPAEVNRRGQRKELKWGVLADPPTFSCNLHFLLFSSALPLPLSPIFHKGKWHKGLCSIIRCQQAEIFVVHFLGFLWGWSSLTMKMGVRRAFCQQMRHIWGQRLSYTQKGTPIATWNTKHKDQAQ